MRVETSDENLVTLAQSGDAAAFSALVSRHYDLIHRVGYRVLGSQTEAQDMAQDLCLSLASKIKSFRADAKFTTWLYRVAINAARDRIRKRTTRQKATEGWGDYEQNARAVDAENRAQLDWLNQAMKTLPDDLRETVALVLGEDLTHDAAAAALNISPGTVSWRISEVKKHLRALAEKEELIQ
jgi:RNA polymerase sigma-70 factor (ECF subfamily)